MNLHPIFQMALAPIMPRERGTWKRAEILPAPTVDDEIAEEPDDTCPACDGTGEGAYDGANCMSCRGRGVAK